MLKAEGNILSTLQFCIMAGVHGRDLGLMCGHGTLSVWVPIVYELMIIHNLEPDNHK